MNEKDYEIILTLYETKNITKAAQKLYLTQPTLTKRIKSIESNLGFELILRSKKGVLFTPLGESIIPYIKSINSTIKIMKEHIESNQGFICGTINIGISINFAKYRFAPILKDFTLKYPNVNIKVVVSQSSNIYDMLKNDEISIAIVRGGFQWDEGKILLSKDPIYLVCKDEYSIDELNSFSFINRRTDSAFQFLIKKWFNENNLLINYSKLSIDNTETIIEMCKSGVGWSILPKICLDNFEGYKKPLYFNDGTPFERESYILYKNSYYKLPQVELLVKSIIDSEHQ
ncbi:MAG: LysR family transcriptional regulator [Peptostreptococcaceae bacterium]